jgi:hypothetical protein
MISDLIVSAVSICFFWSFFKRFKEKRYLDLLGGVVFFSLHKLCQIITQNPDVNQYGVDAIFIIVLMIFAYFNKSWITSFAQKLFQKQSNP